MTKTKITMDQIDRIIKFHEKDLTLREIAAIIGLSYETIRKVIMKYCRVGQYNTNKKLKKK